MEYRGAKKNPEVFVFMKFEGAAFIRAVASAPVPSKQRGTIVQLKIKKTNHEVFVPF